MPDMSGRPRSRTTTSGLCSAADAQCLRAGGRGVHLVAADGQVDAQRPQDLRFVVDHQHPGHRRVLRRRGEVDHDGQTAAGGVGGGDGAAHRLDETPCDRQAEPDAGGVVVVAEALEGREQFVARRPRGTPGPSSTTLISTRSPTRPALTRTMPSGA